MSLLSWSFSQSQLLPCRPQIFRDLKGIHYVNYAYWSEVKSLLFPLYIFLAEFSKSQSKNLIRNNEVIIKFIKMVSLGENISRDWNPHLWLYNFEHLQIAISDLLSYVYITTFLRYLGKFTFVTFMKIVYAATFLHSMMFIYTPITIILKVRV